MQFAAGEPFVTFGPSAYLPKRQRSASLEVVRDRRAVRRELRRICPQSAGVYGMIDLAGRLVYVGKAGNLLKRLITYFLGAAPHDQVSHTREDDHRKELRVSR